MLGPSELSLPKFKRDGKVKGFAFVQFEKPEEAQKALDAISSDKGETAVKSMDPGELESIKSYQEEQLMELKDEEGRKSKKRKSEDATAAAKDVSIKSEPEGDEDDDSDSPPMKKVKSEEGEEKAVGHVATMMLTAHTPGPQRVCGRRCAWLLACAGCLDLRSWMLPCWQILGSFAPLFDYKYF